MTALCCLQKQAGTQRLFLCQLYVSPPVCPSVFASACPAHFNMLNCLSRLHWPTFVFPGTLKPKQYFVESSETWNISCLLNGFLSLTFLRQGHHAVWYFLNLCHLDYYCKGDFKWLCYSKSLNITTFATNVCIWYCIFLGFISFYMTWMWNTLWPWSGTLNGCICNMLFQNVNYTLFYLLIMASWHYMNSVSCDFYFTI